MLIVVREIFWLITTIVLVLCNNIVPQVVHVVTLRMLCIFAPIFVVHKLDMVVCESVHFCAVTLLSSSLVFFS